MDEDKPITVRLNRFPRPLIDVVTQTSYPPRYAAGEVADGRQLDVILEPLAEVMRRSQIVEEGRDWFNWLLERAEDADSAGLSQEDALEAVRCAYSSLAADEDVRRDP